MYIALHRFVRSSLVVWAVVACFGVYFLATIRRQVSFGIDLVGGTYVTLELQVDELLQGELHDRIASVLRVLRGSGVGELVSEKAQPNGVVVTMGSLSDAQQLVDALRSRVDQLSVITKQDDVHVVCSFSDQVRRQLIKQAVDNNIAVLGIRLDKFGVGEVQVAAQGDRQIFVELPEVQDSAQARAIIGKSAILEIKPVLDVARTEAELLQRTGGKIPDGRSVVSVARTQSEGATQFCLVPRYAEITGKHLKLARANPLGGRHQLEPVVEFTLNAEGAQRFYKMTMVPQATIAIIIDGVAVTVATAKSPIPDGSVVLSGGDFTVESVQELAKLLSSGVFAAPMQPVEDRMIGPSLGAAAIRQGVQACALGLASLFCFSVWFYGVAGILAFIVLLFNLLLILFALSGLSATLTLSGIYGMVLTLGMAIDASVLVYEKIREELARGLSLEAAIEAGFSGALAVILDANLTTLAAAVTLYVFSTGQVQGFAATMAIGIVSTLITGLFLLRALLRYVVRGFGVRTLRF